MVLLRHKPKFTGIPGKKRSSSLRFDTGIRLGRTPILLNEEGMHQWTVIRWLQERGISHLHPANEDKRGILTGFVLKLLGLRPGAPDILIFDPPPAYPGKVGFAIEMKSMKGKPTAPQLLFLEELRSRNWLTAVCYGQENAIQDLRQAGYDRNFGNKGKDSRMPDQGLKSSERRP